MKKLVIILSAIGIVFVSNITLADNTQSPTVYGTDPIWASVIARNQDNSNGPAQLYVGQTKVSGLLIGDFTYNTNNNGYWKGSAITEPSAIFNLYDAELYADTQLNPYIRSHLALAYGTIGSSYGNPARASNNVLGSTYATSTPTTNNAFFFPEAYVTFFDNSTWFAKVGQEYLNFGSTTHQAITTPLPQVFTLMNATAVTAGFVNVLDGLYFDGTVYNGNPYGLTTSTSFANSSVQAHGYVFDLGYTQATDEQNYNIYVDYASNIDNSVSIENEFASASTPMLQETPAIAVHGDYRAGLITLNADYFSVLQRFNPTNWTFNDQGAKPAAYSLQATYTLNVGEHATSFVLGYEGSQNALNFLPLGAAYPMPEVRFLVNYNISLMKNVMLQFEYDNDKDYSLSDTSSLSVNGINFGSSSTDNSVLARLNLSF